MFIALEGIDGSGTTTQSKKLGSALQALGHSVFRTAQPSGGRMGKLAREMLGEHENPLTHRNHSLALAFAGDRLDHYDRAIAPALQRGEIVICDRYLLSSWVYQSLTLPLEWVKTINQFAPWPDLTLVIDVDAATAHKRVQARQGTKEIFDALNLQESLARSYRKLAQHEEGREVQLVDGHASIEDLSETLLAQILALHAKRSTRR